MVEKEKIKNPLFFSFSTIFSFGYFWKLWIHEEKLERNAIEEKTKMNNLFFKKIQTLILF